MSETQYTSMYKHCECSGNVWNIPDNSTGVCIKVSEKCEISIYVECAKMLWLWNTLSTTSQECVKNPGVCGIFRTIILVSIKKSQKMQNFWSFNSDIHKTCRNAFAMECIKCNTPGECTNIINMLGMCRIFRTTTLVSVKSSEKIWNFNPDVYATCKNDWGAEFQKYNAPRTCTSVIKVPWMSEINNPGVHKVVQSIFS